MLLIDFCEYLQTSTVSLAFAKLNKLQDDIDKSETSIEEAEKKCQSKIKAELETEQRIAACMEQKNKLENDLQHKINEVGSGKISFKCSSL